MTGTVKFFDVEKRYGFITGDDNREIFVHQSDVREEHRPLNKGDRVEFEIGASPKGEKAASVRVVQRSGLRRGHQGNQNNTNMRGNRS